MGSVGAVCAANLRPSGKDMLNCDMYLSIIHGRSLPREIRESDTQPGFLGYMHFIAFLSLHMHVSSLYRALYGAFRSHQEAKWLSNQASCACKGTVGR